MGQHLDFLRTEVEGAQRSAMFQMRQAALQGGALDFIRRAVLADPLQAPLGLFEVGKHELILDTFKGSKQIRTTHGRARDNDQYRVEFAHQRDQRRIQNSAGLGFLLACGEIKQGQLHRESFFPIDKPARENPDGYREP